jgi:hypothetical protein
MDLVFDIETDDIQATLVHCIVAQDANSGEIFKFPPHKLGCLILPEMVVTA